VQSAVPIQGSQPDATGMGAVVSGEPPAFLVAHHSGPASEERTLERAVFQPGFPAEGIVAAQNVSEVKTRGVVVPHQTTEQHQKILRCSTTGMWMKE